MTSRQMQKEFEQSGKYIDVIRTNPEMRLISDDVNYYLNEAQSVYINTRLSAIKRSIKNSQRELDEIRTLFIKGLSLSKDLVLSTDQYFVYTLPVNYLYLISDYTNVAYCNANSTVQNRLYSSENLQDILNGSHTKSHPKSPVSELINNKLYVYRDNDLTFTINSVKIDYIKTFVSIDVIGDVDSELDSSVHKDIVQQAVNIFLEAVNQGRFQSNTEKNILTEQIK